MYIPAMSSVTSNKQFKAILMKNIDEEYMTIPSQYINKILYKSQQCDELSITIPKYININGNMKSINPLWGKIKGKNQVIIINDNEEYVIKDYPIKVDRNGEKFQEITAYRGEYRLNESDEFIIEGEGESLALYHEYTDSERNSILDRFEESTGYKVAYISENALKENTIKKVENKECLYKNFSINEIKENEMLWQENLEEVKPFDASCGLKIAIDYGTIKIYNKDTNLLQKEEILKHEFDIFYDEVKSITAKYVNTRDEKGCIEYSFYLKDGMKITNTQSFFDVEGLKIIFEKVELIYQTGEEKEEFVLKKRYWEETQAKWYSFLMEEVTVVYDVMFFFDSLNMKLYCYSKDEYGKHTGISLDYSNYLKTLSITPQTSELCTRLKITSSNEGVSIKDVNPNGEDYIENYDYFINAGLMTESCQQAWRRYINVIEANHNILMTYKKNLNDNRSNKNKLDIKKQTYEQRVNYLKSLINSELETSQELKSELTERTNELKVIETELLKVDESVSILESAIRNIKNNMKKENVTDDDGKIFTNRNLLELKKLQINQTINDENYTNSNELYEFYKYLLEEKNKIPIECECEIDGIMQFMNIPPNVDWRDVITVSNFIDLNEEDAKKFNVKKVRLIEVEYIPPRPNSSDKITKFSISEKDRKLDDLIRLGYNFYRNQKKNKVILDRYKQSIRKSKSYNNVIKDITENGFDVGKTNINGTDKNLIISGSSIYSVTKENKNIQMGLINGEIRKTENNWITSSVVLGLNGINMDGSSVNIVDEKGEVVLNNKGMITWVNYTAQENIGAGGNLQLYIPMLDQDQIKECRLWLYNIPFRRYTASTTEEAGNYYKATETSSPTTSSYAEHRHDYSINIASHRHNIVNMVDYETNELCSNISIINQENEKIIENLNNDIELDITEYMKNSTNNKLTFTSESNGRVAIQIMLKVFRNF